MAIKRQSVINSQETPAWKNSSRSAEAFRQIAIVCANHINGVDISAHYAFVKKLFGLDRMKAEMLSLLLFRRIGARDATQTVQYINVSRLIISEMWQILEKDGFVTKEFHPETGAVGYEIRNTFRYAINEDISLSDARCVLAEEEFLSSLRKFYHGEPRKATPRRRVAAAGVLWTEATKPQEDNPYQDEEVFGDPLDEDLMDFHSCVGNLSIMEFWLTEYAGTSIAEAVGKLTDGLDNDAKILLYGMMEWFVENFTTTARRDDFPAKLRDAFDYGLDALIQKGLAVSVYVWNEQEKCADSNHYRISPRCAEVFRGMEKRFNTSVLSEFGTFTPSGDIMPKELFYPEQDMRNIMRLRAAAAPAEYVRIIDALKAAGMRPCLSALLWGAPGTGKTELARQIARDTGRSILVVDVPKIFGIYIGEGSIRLRDLFQTYRYICAVSKVSPILFMDEADGILSQRVSSSRSASDKDANTMQSVILEELNTMPGMFIATTNLIQNLDDAMLRRFMIKAEFHLPDAPTRARLWRSKFPALSQEEATELSERYAVSGGIIDNIVSIAIVDGILDRRTITADDLRLYCEEQGLGKTGSHKIGF